MMRRAVCVVAGTVVGCACTAARVASRRWRAARDRRWAAYENALAAEIRAAADAANRLRSTPTAVRHCRP